MFIYLLISTNVMQKTTLNNTVKTATWLKRVTDACPHGDYSQFRAEVIFRCGWNSRSTYTNKIRGISDLTLGEYAVIKALCKNYGVPTFEKHAEMQKVI